MKKLLLIWGIMIWGFTALQAKTAKDSASLYVTVGEPAAVDEQFRRNVAVGAAQLRHLLLSEETAQGGLFVLDFAAAMPAALAGETFIDHTPEKTLALNGKTYQVRQWAGSARTEVGQYLNKLNEQAALNGVKLFLGINLYLGETYRGHAISSYDPGTGLRSEKLQYGASQIARRFDSLMVAINQEANVPNARYVVLGRGLFVEEGTQLVGIWQHQANGVTLNINTTLLKQGMNGQTLNEAAKTYLNALFSAVTGQALPWEYIAEGRFKDRSGKLNSSQRQEIETRTQELNTKLRAHGLEMTTVAVNATAKDSVIKEASSKNLQLGTDTPWQIEDVLVFPFLKSLQGNYDISCEKQKIKERMDKLRASPSYSTVYGSLPKFQKILYSTEAFFYNTLVSTLLCRFDAAKFEGSRAKYDSTGMSSGCTEAFIAGALYGVIEDFDVLTLAVDLEGLVKQQGGARLDMYLNYPAKLAAFRQKLTNIPQGKRLFEVVTAADIVSVLPPHIAIQVQDAQMAYNMLEFLQKHYIQDASCWKSGQLAAMVVPIVATAGAYAAAKIPALAGRITKLISTGSELVSAFRSGRRFAYHDVITPNRRIKQTVEVGSDGKTVNIHEETPTGLQKICGSCLAQNTAVFGTNATLENLQPLTTVQTLEKDGSIGTRSAWGKVGRKVSEYAKIFVGGEALSSSTDHEFKTSDGWKPANYLRKGILLFSLALNSFVSIDSAFVVNEPLQVEGLALGDVQGYGVGTLGVVVAQSPTCVLGLSGSSHEKILNKLGDSFLQEIQNKVGLVKAIEGLGTKLDDFLDEIIKSPVFKQRTLNNSDYVRAFKEYVPNKIYQINGRNPVNSGLAGQTVNTQSGFPVTFDNNGFPDFTPYVPNKPGGGKYAFEIDMTGNDIKDFKEANAKAGFGATYDSHLTCCNGQFTNYTWHHHQDGKTMILVPKNINNPANGGISHTGGRQTVNHNSTSLNNVLYFPEPKFN